MSTIRTAQRFYLLLTMLFLSMVSCNSNQQVTQNDDSINNTNTIEIQNEKIEDVDATESAKEEKLKKTDAANKMEAEALEIYAGGAFISIGTNPIPNVIERKYLDARINQDHEHVLNATNRKTFFNAANLSENDTLFSYSFQLDSILKYSLSELELSAFLSPYDEPFNDVRSYYIGFYVPNSNSNLVHIGKLNPFVVGQLKPMIWNKIDRSDFPIIACRYDTLNVANEYVEKPYSNFSFNSFGLQYYLCIVDKDRRTNHLVVIDSTSKEIVFERVYQFIDEEYVDIDVVGNKKYHYNHWTGSIFKNKPIAIYGYTPAMWGCPEIQFIGKNTKDLYLYCDNRH